MSSQNIILWQNFGFSKKAAESRLIDIHKNYIEGKEFVCDYNPVFSDLRKEISEKNEEIKKNIIISTNKDKNNDKLGYKYDCKLGLALYSATLPGKGKYSLSTIQASNDRLWRYLSVAVFPDVIFERWGWDPIPYDRFIKTPQRNYLKSLWWYIHLSWQNNLEDTEEAIKNNTTDTIVSLVERSGKAGYITELYRTIIKNYSKYNSAKKTDHQQLFRDVMKLNTANMVNIDPECFKGGIAEYVEYLFSEVRKSYGDKHK